MSQPVGPRYCKYELSGESNIYICPKDEYCCNVGCCISPTFQFYQLWYYWFMVFFMFLICSGGQWWYRYVMQGRCASTMPPPPRRATSYPRQCRVAYTPARDTVVLHHLWKPTYTGINGPPPSYSQSGASSSSGLGGPKPSPYIQLYGPPPSYESVIGAGPVPIHHLTGPGSGGAGGVMEVLDQVPASQRAQTVEVSHHHHRQGSSGRGNSSRQQSGQDHMDEECNNTFIDVRRCSSAFQLDLLQHLAPIPKHRLQKHLIEPTRYRSESGVGDGGVPPGRAQSEGNAVSSRPPGTECPPLPESPKPDQERATILDVPPPLLDPAQPPSPQRT